VDKAHYEALRALPDGDLFSFVTEKDSSQRKWVALYILETRKVKIARNVAIFSAVAAGLSAVVAIVNLIIQLSM